MNTEVERAAVAPRPGSFSAGTTLRNLFIRLGVLPFFLVVALIVFSLASNKFMTFANMTNVARQSAYLIVVALGQMLALVTGGFDLSVGTAIAMTSVVSATAMVSVASIFPHMAWLAVAIGVLAGLGAALAIGTVNGIGIAQFGVSPFIMTLGVQSVGAGIALFITGGVPIGNLPNAFSEAFGFANVAGIPVPVAVALLAAVSMWVLMNRTRTGARLYAVGGNVKAANLSGINTKRILFLAYVYCSLLAAVAGILLSARVESGDTNLGGSSALESIAACVIAGVSLRGGIGRVENVVIGGFFIVLAENGMNILQIGSYMQMVLLGGLLILAVVVDQFRYRLLIGDR